MSQRICPICRKETDDMICTEDQVPTVAQQAIETPADETMVGKALANRYEVKQLVGTGGMSRVYEAVQCSFGRRVALKVIDRRLASDLTQIERFYLEARASSRLDHPNTIRVYDFGVTDDGLPYIAMEFLDGETLKERKKREKNLPIYQTLTIFSAVASALVEAHHAGIIHRDLKPDNIFLKKVKGVGEVVKVCDFGIAKLMQDGDDDSQRNLTKTGHLVGTPRYMAPEQIEGGAIGPWTDFYALGTMLYEFLAGVTPLQASDSQSLLYLKLRNAAPPLPGLGPSGPIPEALRALVDGLLLSDPQRRAHKTEHIANWLVAIMEERYDDVPTERLRQIATEELDCTTAVMKKGKIPTLASLDMPEYDSASGTGPGHPSTLFLQNEPRIPTDPSGELPIPENLEPGSDTYPTGSLPRPVQKSLERSRTIWLLPVVVLVLGGAGLLFLRQIDATGETQPASARAKAPDALIHREVPTKRMEDIEDDEESTKGASASGVGVKETNKEDAEPEKEDPQAAAERALAVKQAQQFGQHGDKARGKKNYTEALKLYQYALDLDPDNVEVRNKMASVRDEMLNLLETDEARKEEDAKKKKRAPRQPKKKAAKPAASKPAKKSNASDYEILE
jgi:serine/threonine protein kinase